MNINSFKCYCKQGYTGEKCETLIDICSTKPCLNSVGCSSSNGTLNCTCMSGFYGRRCEVFILNYCYVLEFN